MARDEWLKFQLREAILFDRSYDALAISPYVSMERGFVVGLVEDAIESEANLALVPDILQSQIDIKVLSGDVVQLGVVASGKIRSAAEREARRVGGVRRVTNPLLLPESGYMKRRLLLT